ncbi:hypothetical protein NM688_g8849 [Phlebia brevispora]|uniref:Uncharacterized protein n=1 Tax=Phlebia brevispora TaxID=194682 RepID=A0ACC1RPB7_9APHY|nr:hypothetical protein NM688_g8849 [Phlebia brevispora]
MSLILDEFSVFLNRHNISFSQLILTMLSPRTEHKLAEDILSSSTAILEAFSEHPVASDAARQFAHKTAIEIYSDELDDLTSVDAGWHFNHANCTTKQVTEFRLEKMAEDMQSTAPHLTEVLDSLLIGRKKLRQDEMEIDEDDGPGDSGQMGSRGKMKARRTQKHPAVRSVKRVAISSMLMQGRNQKANWLQSLCGLFLHANNTPQKVIDTLAQLGLSTSLSSIHRALDSLIACAKDEIKALGKTLTIGYCYDNFDVDMRSAIPTVEKSGDSLRHLTAGLVFPLHLDISLADLDCANFLWSRSPYNPRATASVITDWRKLLRLHEELREAEGADELTARDRFCVWQFLHDLIYFRPPGFAVHKDKLGLPEILEQLPVEKTPITPLQTTLDNNAEVAGNIDTIRHILEQTGVGDLKHVKAQVVDIGNHVIIIHGDVGTGEKVELALDRRSQEDTLWLRLQRVVFVDGVFHLKMACADALWRIFLRHSNVRKDATSLMRDVSKLRPKETGIIGSKPGFRRMHQVIQHAGRGTSVRDLRKHTAQVRDEQWENTLLLNQYFLLYEELTFAMNYGNIKRLEACYFPWICLFKATGKHKYSKRMIKHLLKLYYVYPEALRKAVRYSMLINPTGKPGCFRAVDWCMELNNLYTKIIYGGSSSNYTVKRIIKESILIQLFRDISEMFEENLQLTHLTAKHGDADMTATFREVLEYLRNEKTNEIIPGRRSAHEIADLLDKGQHMLHQATEADDEVTEETDHVDITAEDLEVDL